MPGVQVSIRLADRWNWSGHAGFADLAGHQTVTSTTPFGAGSITKTFVAALVLLLADQGVFALDDPIARWLPGVRNAAGVTIRQLLDHTSGVDDAFSHVKMLDSIGAAPRATWPADRVMGYVKKPHFKPGEGWYYSNTNYLLLGQLVETATGRTVASLLRERFLGPLGLADTFLQGQEPLAATPAHGYDFTGVSWKVKDLSDGTAMVPFTSLATAIGTAGAIVTTADDLARWAEALYGRRVLSPAALAGMLDFTATRALKPLWPYGLGVQRITLRGRGSWGHSGLISGFRATMRYFPADRLTIVVMTNANGVDPDRIVQSLMDVIYPPPIPAPSPAPSPPVPSPSLPAYDLPSPSESSTGSGRLNPADAFSASVAVTSLAIAPPSSSHAVMAGSTADRIGRPMGRERAGPACDY